MASTIISGTRQYHPYATDVILSHCINSDCLSKFIEFLYELMGCISFGSLIMAPWPSTSIWTNAECSPWLYIHQ